MHPLIGKLNGKKFIKYTAYIQIGVDSIVHFQKVFDIVVFKKKLLKSTLLFC